MQRPFRAGICGKLLWALLACSSRLAFAGDVPAETAAGPLIAPVATPIVHATWQQASPPKTTWAGYRYPFNYPYYRFKPRHYPFGRPRSYPFAFPRPGHYPFGTGPYGPSPWNYGGYTGNGFDHGVYGDPVGRFGGVNPYYYGKGSSNFGPIPRGYATTNLGWMGSMPMSIFGSYPMHTFGYMYGPPGGYGYFSNVAGVDIDADYPEAGFDYEDLRSRSYRRRAPFVDYGYGGGYRHYGPAVYGTGNIVPMGGFYQGW